MGVGGWGNGGVGGGEFGLVVRGFFYSVCSALDLGCRMRGFLRYSVVFGL